MKQLSIFDQVDRKSRLVGLAKELEQIIIERYMKKKVPMNILAKMLNVPERTIRALVNEVRVNSNQIYILADNNGYSGILKEKCIVDPNIFSRTKGSIKRMVQSNPNTLPLFYEILNELKEGVKNDSL